MSAYNEKGASSTKEIIYKMSNLEHKKQKKFNVRTKACAKRDKETKKRPDLTHVSFQGVERKCLRNLIAGHGGTRL